MGARGREGELGRGGKGRGRGSTTNRRHCPSSYPWRPRPGPTRGLVKHGANHTARMLYRVLAERCPRCAPDVAAMMPAFLPGYGRDVFIVKTKVLSD